MWAAQGDHLFFNMNRPVIACHIYQTFCQEIKHFFLSERLHPAVDHFGV